MSILSVFRKKKPATVDLASSEPMEAAERGILVFENTSEVISAEQLLRKQGADIRVMGPPPEIRPLEDSLYIDDIPIDINRGTPALLGAAAATAGVVNASLSACLVGDKGTGKGSRRLYSRLAEELPDAGYDTIAFHYLQTVIHWHRELQAVLASMDPRPRLIADAGFMYVAKMSGEASL